MKLKNIPLQAIQIPTGWTVVWNQFYDIEPGADIEIEGLPDGDVWELFIQDLLQLKYFKRNLVLDMGWTPEADPNGSYKLTIVENEDWLNPIVDLESRIKDEIVEQINIFLRRIASGDL